MHPISPFPIRICPKPARFYTQTVGAGHFGAYAFAPLPGYMQNLLGFIFPHTDTPQNPPDFTLPNKDAPKSRPVLYLNLRRETFRGVCNTPLHGYVQNLAGFRRKPLSRDISERMQYAPTQVHEKFGGFHISVSGYAKNQPNFRLKPSARDISGRMLLRTYTGTCKIWRVLDFVTRHGAKPGGFWTLPHDMTRNPAGFGLCHST